jgi:hypothetical protein
MFKTKDYFILVAAIGSMIYSICLWFGIAGVPNHDGGMFVGIWVPSILALGCFAKLARLTGDRA